jgi:hypothetical protein
MALTDRIYSAILHAMGRPVTTQDLLTTERRAAFERFQRLIKTLRTPLRKIVAKDYACFVAGSDQIWNPNFIAYGHPETLPFASEGKRVALAASIGISHIRDADKDWFAREIGRFDHISVREDRAAEIVRELTRREAEVVIDPTLAMEGDEWRTLADDRLTPAEPFVFAYLLGGTGKDASSALATASENGASVLTLSDRDKPGELPAGPAEFISLVDHATHVVTDSFHAAAFSVLLGTPLTIVRRQGDTSMFSRLESLARMLCLEDCIYGSPEYHAKLSGDRQQTYERLVEERVRFHNFLSKSMPKCPAAMIGANASAGDHRQK